MNNPIEVTASPPKVERQGERIVISFSADGFPVNLNFTKGQAKRISKELLEAVNETE